MASAYVSPESATFLNAIKDLNLAWFRWNSGPRSLIPFLLRSVANSLTALANHIDGELHEERRQRAAELMERAGGQA